MAPRLVYKLVHCNILEGENIRAAKLVAVFMSFRRHWIGLDMLEKRGKEGRRNGGRNVNKGNLVMTWFDMVRSRPQRRSPALGRGYRAAATPRRTTDDGRVDDAKCGLTDAVVWLSRYASSRRLLYNCPAVRDYLLSKIACPSCNHRFYIRCWLSPCQQSSAPPRTTPRARRRTTYPVPSARQPRAPSST